jgi:hypothetical protein
VARCRTAAARAVLFLLWILARRFQIERGGIHAIAESSGRRAIFKHVPEMRATVGATRFHPRHPIAIVGMLLHVGRINGSPETRPACAGIKFGLRRK